MPSMLEPDQRAERWDEHVAGYETAFEPFTLALARPALKLLRLPPNGSVLDVAAGPGAVALVLAQSGHRVTAIDASPAMVARIASRTREAGIEVEAHVMDACQLAFANATFDAAISAFGIVLVPDAAAALAEMARVVRPGGRIAVVAWTEPQRYELAATLMAAVGSILPNRPRPPLPAQLRFCERDALDGLFRAAGLAAPDVEPVEAFLEAPSAQWLASNLSFAPGMAAMLDGLGEQRADVMMAFVRALEDRFGTDPVRLAGRAHIGVSMAR